MASGRRRKHLWDRLPAAPEATLIWVRDGASYSADISPQRMGYLRSTMEALLALTTRRLRMHAEGRLGEFEMDARLGSLLEMRRRAHQSPRATELEMLIPMANRYRRVIDLLPEFATTLVLPDLTARHDLGIAALDLVQAIDRWLFALARGQHLWASDARRQPRLELLAAARDWTAEQIVEKLRPEPEEGPVRYGPF